MTEEYRRYLASEEWEKTRQRALAYHGRRCAACGTTKRLQVHHLTYARLGHEWMSDFRILCKSCHIQGRYSAWEIERDRTSLKYVNALVAGSQCLWWLFKQPFRLALWAFRHVHPFS